MLEDAFLDIRKSFSNKEMHALRIFVLNRMKFLFYLLRYSTYNTTTCHPREGGDPLLPAPALRSKTFYAFPLRCAYAFPAEQWIPAFAGMTPNVVFYYFDSTSNSYLIQVTIFEYKYDIAYIQGSRRYPASKTP